MFDKLYTQILKKSPWGNYEDESDKKTDNIFTRPRKGNNINFNDLECIRVC